MELVYRQLWQERLGARAELRSGRQIGNTPLFEDFLANNNFVMSHLGLKLNEVFLIFRVVSSQFDVGPSKLRDGFVGLPEGGQKEVNVPLLSSTKDQNP